MEQADLIPTIVSIRDAMQMKLNTLDLICSSPVLCRDGYDCDMEIGPFWSVPSFPYNNR